MKKLGLGATNSQASLGLMLVCSCLLGERKVVQEPGIDNNLPRRTNTSNRKQKTQAWGNTIYIRSLHVFPEANSEVSVFGGKMHVFHKFLKDLCIHGFQFFFFFGTQTNLSFTLVFFHEL